MSYYYEPIRHLPLDEQITILAQRINRAGIRRLKRKGGYVPEAAKEMERQRQARRFRALVGETA